MLRFSFDKDAKDRSRIEGEFIEQLKAGKDSRDMFKMNESISIAYSRYLCIPVQEGS